MSEKKRPRRIPSTRRSTLPFLSGNTILQRFRSLEALRSCNVPKHELIAFLKMTHDTLFRMVESDSIDDEIIEECEDFCDYLTLIYSDDHPAWEWIADNIEDVFLVFRLADLGDAPDLSEEMERCCQKLSEFIFNTRAERTLTVLFSDGDIATYGFPRTIPRNELDDFRAALLEIIRELADRTGVLLFRHAAGIQGVDILNAFLFLEDEVRQFSEEEMYESIIETEAEAGADGVDAPVNKTVYRIADIDLS